MGKLSATIVVVAITGSLGYFGFTTLSQIEVNANLRRAKEAREVKVEEICHSMDRREAVAWHKVSKTYLSEFEQGSFSRELKYAQEHPEQYNGICGEISSRIMQEVKEIFIQRQQVGSYNKVNEWLEENDPRVAKLWEAHKLRTEMFLIREKVDAATTSQELELVDEKIKTIQDKHDALFIETENKT